MDLNIIWFVLITVLFIGFFVLEGFDYGVGMLLPVVAKSDDERRVVLNTIGPSWDGNEVWLITAGGAMFAAFPMVYATMFSGFYLALFLILLALILRATGLEFRSKREGASWRRNWDTVVGVSSFLNAFLWGVAVSNLVTGVPIDAEMQFRGTFFTLLTPFTLLGGVMLTLVFAYHGGTFLEIRTGDDKIRERLAEKLPLLGVAMLAAVVCWVCWAFFTTGLLDTPFSLITCALTALCLIFSVLLTVKKRGGLAFIFGALGIALCVVTVFGGMFPDIMISTLGDAYSLNIYNAASSPKTLSFMTKVAFTLVPVVLIYQGWSFYVFRKRVTKDDLHY